MLITGAFAQRATSRMYLFPSPGNQIVPDGDAVTVTRKDNARVLGALTVRHLHHVGSQEMRVAAQLRDARLEGIARARGLVEKHQENRLVRQVAVRNPVLELPLEIAGNFQQGFNLGIRPLLRRDVILAFEKRLLGDHGWTPF